MIKVFVYWVQNCYRSSLYQDHVLMRWNKYSKKTAKQKLLNVVQISSGNIAEFGMGGPTQTRPPFSCERNGGFWHYSFGY